MTQGIYNQRATYWAAGAMNGHGERTFASPVLLWVRWQDGLRLIRNSSNEEIPCEAIVWVQQVVTIGDYLALGDYTGTANPLAEALAFTVFQSEDCPSVNGQEIIRKRFLKAGRR